MPVVAIDGPSGSGKSSVARGVARKLGVSYLDTGAMYRAVALASVKAGASLDDPEAVAKIARAVQIDMQQSMTEGDGRNLVLVDGVDATDDLRSPEMSKGASAVGVHIPVRAELVRRQQEWVAAQPNGAVVEGRDIGMVVCPDADLKVYLDASPEVRVKRRSHEVPEASTEQTAAEIAWRDKNDSTRTATPLVVADGAVVIDTSDMSVDEVIDDIVGRL